mmetsp:Transcript_12602/g.15259  ORF Transcript_12602/g.15259 Transcript_12602/m.15259 type:complete len:221 (+) Transcript_12602:331-993(+)
MLHSKAFEKASIPSLSGLNYTMKPSSTIGFSGNSMSCAFDSHHGQNAVRAYRFLTFPYTQEHKIYRNEINMNNMALTSFLYFCSFESRTTLTLLIRLLTKSCFSIESFTIPRYRLRLCSSDTESFIKELKSAALLMQLISSDFSTTFWVDALSPSCIAVAFKSCTLHFVKSKLGYVPELQLPDMVDDPDPVAPGLLTTADTAPSPLLRTTCFGLFSGGKP